MDIRTSIATVDRIAELDEARREAFQAELESFEAEDVDRFEQTWSYVREQRAELDQLEQYVTAEREKLQELVTETAFFTTEQAVRNRDQAVEKIRNRNEQLARYCESVSAALDAVESNLTALESEADELPANAEPHFTEATDAVEAHNKYTEGLDRNMAILSAYLP